LRDAIIKWQPDDSQGSQPKGHPLFAIQCHTEQTLCRVVKVIGGVDVGRHVRKFLEDYPADVACIDDEDA
jgi:hypothetical protein